MMLIQDYDIYLNQIDAKKKEQKDKQKKYYF